MGVIKDGRVSGNLPSSEAFVIHYPGYPSSTSRAIQTLGGAESIIKARSSQSNKLALHFRPEDPYSHPAFGELHPCNGLLLKISKKKSLGGQNVEVANEMLKNQLPDVTDMGHGQVVGPDSESVAAGKEVDMQISDENRIILSADIVARVYEAYHFDGMADYQHVVSVHADVARRKKRNWTEVERPLSGKDRTKKLDEDDVMMLLPPLFAPKDVPENVMLLLGIAYYFSNGPFSKLWIRKGYDPRKDPESRIYQRIDFRIKPTLLSYCDASTDTELKRRWKDLCAFQVFPTKCSTVLQLYELVDDYIQQEIKKPPKQSTCSLKSGWFSESMFDVIRKRIEVRFMSVYPGAGAEKLLKAAFEGFEKLKKSCIYKDTLQPDQVELQEFNKGDEDKEKPEIVDDDEEGIIEVDEPIEESDADEALDLVSLHMDLSIVASDFLNVVRYKFGEQLKIIFARALWQFSIVWS